MGERHVEELHSRAYDDALSEAERARYEDHLARCEACAATAEELRVAIDAVRAMPAARMPVRVVLPATPPVAERRAWLSPLRLPRPGPVWGAGAMAAVGIAAVVVAVHLHGGGGASVTGSSTALSQLAPLAPDAKSAAGPAGSSASCAVPILSTTAQAGSSGPAGFSNRVKVTIPQRPGQELVLATTSSHYTAGSEVLVFAALTTSTGQHTSVVPCVTLQGPSRGALDQQSAAGQALSAAPGGGSSTQSPVALNGNATSGTLHAPYWADIPLAIAVPTSQSVAGTLPVQLVTIPANIPKGTVLRLVAFIPAGFPGSSDGPAVEAVLTVDVS